MDKHIDLTGLQGICKCCRILIGLQRIICNAMNLHILLKFGFAHIAFHHSVGQILHLLKIFVCQLTVTPDCQHAVRISAGQTCIPILCFTLSRVLSGTYQVNLTVFQLIERIVPTAALHKFKFPVCVLAYLLQIFYIHPGHFSVLINIIVALHGKNATFTVRFPSDATAVPLQ